MTSSDSRSALPHFVGYSAYTVRPLRGLLSTRQASLYAADWWVAPSLKKARPHASTPGSLRTPVGCYRGTWLLLRPDFHRLVVVNLRTHHDLGIVIGQRAGMPRCRPTRRANSGERYIRRIEAIK